MPVTQTQLNSSWLCSLYLMDVWDYSTNNLFRSTFVFNSRQQYIVVTDYAFYTVIVSNMMSPCTVSQMTFNWCRSDEELPMGSSEYFSRRRNILERQGFRIRGVISSQMDALTGPSLGSRVFKIPNPIYFNTEYYTKSTNLQEIF